MFDVLAWASGGALSVALYRWRLRAAVAVVASQTGPGYFASLAIGAASGAWLAGSLNTMRDAIPVLSHSVAGALAGAIVGVEAYKAVRGIRGSTGTVFVGSFSLGVAIGRWGCLFAGLSDDTYGVPAELPWSVDLGDGIGRHPVEIYESLAMVVFLGVFLGGLAARRGWAMRRGFYAMCAWYGVQRFAWEFLKPYPRIAGPFNVFHIVSLGLVIYGCIYFARDRLDERRAAVRTLSVPRPDHEFV